MKWHEIKIITTEEAYDAISEMLISMGAGGVAIEDPNEIRREIAKPNSLDYADDEFLSSLGDDVVIKVYFPGEVNIIEMTDLIKEKINYISNFLVVGEGYKDFKDVDDEDWSTSWKKYYKPVRISERVTIKPTWEEYISAEGEVVVELDPGMAFGTGTHETTQMCARLLEQRLKAGDTVIDVGCGTGILSIIASKLGAGQIEAIDIDDIAVRVAKENCEINNVSHNVNVSKGVLKDINIKKVDLIVANIIANVIIDISELVPYYVGANGYFVASGIIRERKQEILDLYRSKGFTCETALELGEWVAIVFKCQDFS
jgi:ribosomal protein L11 methyltransferase